MERIKTMKINVKKSLKYGLNTLFSTVLVIGIITIVLMLSYSHNKRFDLTEEKKFTLSDQTTKILRELDQEVEVLVFNADDGNFINQANSMLDQYKFHSKKFRVKTINTNKEPVEARKYNLSSPNSLVIKTQDKQEVVARITEEEVTNALVRILSQGRTMVYFSEGHGEKNLSDGKADQFLVASEALNKGSYDVKTINLMKQVIPPDCDLLVIAGPKTDFASETLKQVDNYLDKGGAVFVMLDSLEEYPKLNNFLREKGLKIDNDIILDPISNQLLGSYFMPVGVYGRHKIVENFNIITFFQLARPLSIIEDGPENIRWTSVVNSSPNSLSKPSKSIKGDRLVLDENDKRGPFTIAAAASWTPEKDTASDSPDTPTKSKKKEARLVVAGNTNFATNQFFSQVGNGDLFLNCISWLTENEEFISIRPKESKGAAVFLSKKDKQSLMLVSMALLPLVIILGGVVAFINRD
jgi:ABC-type uncharacterized transport system involved in gliding motility auxiliary subunit